MFKVHLYTDLCYIVLDGLESLALLERLGIQERFQMVMANEEKPLTIEVSETFAKAFPFKFKQSFTVAAEIDIETILNVLPAEAFFLEKSSYPDQRIFKLNPEFWNEASILNYTAAFKKPKPEKKWWQFWL